MSVQIDLAGRVVLVTGGTRGIGRGIARRFLDAGADVIACGRTAPADLPRVGDRTAAFLAADVREPEQVGGLVDEIVARFGRLDVLVNNAGGSPPADAATASPRFSAAIVDLNLHAPLVCAQRANAVMQSQDEGGVIVNIASVSGLRPSPGTAAYGAAKAGLINLTATLAIEWAPKVRVTGVAPGLIATDDAAEHYGGDGGSAAVARTVPLGRFGTPEEVGDACIFLASPLASYASGAVLTLHGGGERPAFLGAADRD
jgi:NAD(P)-dependent dehydrogenase (short-subunit alcohol dehydrogenase family)